MHERSTPVPGKKIHHQFVICLVEFAKNVIKVKTQTLISEKNQSVQPYSVIWALLFKSLHNLQLIIPEVTVEKQNARIDLVCSHKRALALLINSFVCPFRQTTLIFIYIYNIYLGHILILVCCHCTNYQYCVNPTQQNDFIIYPDKRGTQTNSFLISPYNVLYVAATHSNRHVDEKSPYRGSFMGISSLRFHGKNKISVLLSVENSILSGVFHSFKNSLG